LRESQIVISSQNQACSELAARGIFTSVPDLARKLHRYINADSANGRPIQWKYSDLSRRLRNRFLE
jgi:hypothetical protein